MSAHTPGPWEWVKDSWNGGYSGLSGPDGAEVLYPDHCNDGDDGAAWFESMPSEADARLIAAAPELLEALKDAVAVMVEAGQEMLEVGLIATPNMLNDSVDVARQAITATEETKA